MKNEPVSQQQGLDGYNWGSQVSLPAAHEHV